MKVLITGATGVIGLRLCRKLIDRGDSVTILSRNPESAKLKIAGAKEYLQWNFEQPEKWKEFLNGKDVVIHLAGINLSSKRWNEKFKKKAYESRITSTRNLVDVIESLDKKPNTFLCASAVGYYGNRNEELLTENSLPANDFLSVLCKDWEKEAFQVEQFGVRRVSIRTGLVLNRGEGLLKKLHLPFKIFVGGPLGNGNQWFPWIHIEDIVGIYLHAIDNENIQGSVNSASPGIVRMKEFAKTFGKILNRPSLFPVPKFALKLIAGELGNHATDSQKISVEKLLKSRYKFKFEDLETALKDLLK